MAMAKIPVSLQLDPNWYDYIKQRAGAADMSVGAFIRLIISRAFAVEKQFPNMLQPEKPPVAQLTHQT